MAGPAGSIAISGLSIGIKWTTYRCIPPPLRRRFAGSSVMEAPRWLATPGGFAAISICPRAPRKAPVPPVIAKLLPPVAVKGAPGGAEPPANPVVTMVPIGVPSLFKISKVNTASPTRTVSAIAWPGVGAVLEKNVLRGAN